MDASLDLKYVLYKADSEGNGYTQGCEDEFVSECTSHGYVSDFVAALKETIF